MDGDGVGMRVEGGGVWSGDEDEGWTGSQWVDGDGGGMGMEGG